MKKLFLSAPVAVFAFWLGALICEQADAAIGEHRPVCAPDGSRFIYMLQSERTQNDWELYQVVFNTQVQNARRTGVSRVASATEVVRLTFP